MRQSMSSRLGALVVAMAATLSACSGASTPATPTGSAVAEVLVHVEVRSATPSSSGDGTWLVTFIKNGQEVTAPTVRNIDMPLVVPGSKAVLHGTLTQAGDLTITSVAPDAG